jgi:hypothetical protein
MAARRELPDPFLDAAEFRPPVLLPSTVGTSILTHELRKHPQGAEIRTRGPDTAHAGGIDH